MAAAKSGMTDTQKTLLTITAVVGGSIIVYHGSKAIKKHRQAKRQRQRDKYDLETGVGTINLQQKAIEIHDAFFGYIVYEDEAAAIRALLQVPKSEVKNLAFIYNKDYGRNLYEDFRKYLTDAQYSEVEEHLN